MSAESKRSERRIKAVWFDFMGTCLDWHSTIVDTLPGKLPHDLKSTFALEWRQAYFDANDARQRRGEPPEDIDVTHRRVLEKMLEQQPSDIAATFTPDICDALIRAWHQQRAWPDMAPALRALRETHGLEVFVHANGTTRLQLDLVRASGLRFDMLFSSELMGHIKPDLRFYEKTLRLLKLRADEIVMVAAHAYDLRGAKEVGTKTVYIYRWTDDIREDQEKLKGEFDEYLDGMEELSSTIEKLL